MILFPTSAIQLAISISMLGFFSWMFYRHYKKSSSIYAKYFSFALGCIPAALLVPLVASFLLYLQIPASSFYQWVNTIAWAIQYFGLSFFAMAGSLYYFPKVSPRIAAGVVLTAGIILTIVNVSTTTTIPTINEGGIVDWKMNSFSSLAYNMLNGAINLPLILIFLKHSFSLKAYLRLVVLFSGFILVVIFAPLPHQTTAFPSFVLYSILANIGMALMFGGILWQMVVQSRKVGERS